MIEQLTQRAQDLKSSLIDIENQFNIKKEEFLKVQGALEALTTLSD